ncbi:ImmA/IrrE family metallo-endopeptidase [Alicyclobacillus sendaiensis]|uniref:ImmA/IrrE family metallo-endopeptidase n=1 Tax=Alicyclobacillus sendaiensis TaxID=192387 RepID=UPI0009FB07EE|nr:ImmA/IrrE family metallo-endopeptidase [Alicyclobacillus sendaiensis]
MDDKLNEMYAIAKREGIVLDWEYLDFRNRKINGIYFYEHIRKKPFIVLNPRIERSQVLYRCVLAEELGHYFTVPFYLCYRPFACYADRLTLSRDEFRALRWAARFLIPDGDIDPRHLENMTIDELADYFNVTVEIMEVRLKLMRYSA